MPSEVSLAGPPHDRKSTIEELMRELAEAREQQAATAGILAAISNSPNDPHRVFADIAANAARLCDASNAGIFQVIGGELCLLASYGPLPKVGPVGQRAFPLTRGGAIGRAVLDRTTIHVADLQDEQHDYPEGSASAQRLGHRTFLAVPLVRAGEAIGAVTIRRAEVRPFTGRQIELLRVFADQAVIAIENTRLLNELRESLQQQTATADVLKVISNSPAVLQAVFDTIVTNVVRLCGAAFGDLHRLEGGRIKLDAQYGVPVEELSILKGKVFPLPLSRESATGRAVIDRAIVHIPDIREDATFRAPLLQSMSGYRTVLAVPMLCEGMPIGALALWRRDVHPFSEREIRIVATFADQAVIAIENARLFEAEQASKRELQESLEYQTATSEVLSVISRSPNDVQPVFDTIARIAQRLCQAEHAFVLQRREGGYRLVAANDAVRDWVTALKANPLLPDRGSLTGRVALDRRTVHVDDLRADPEYTLGPALQHGVRSELGVPLMRDGEVIGVIIVGRTEVRPFTKRQIALVETFADQAVIAIENTRLFEAEQASKHELRESL